MKKKILIIDHEPEYQGRPIRFLEKIYEVKLAISLNAINNRLNENKFDLIFIEPFFPYGKDYEDINVWLFYDEKLKNLSCPIVLWSHHPILLSVFEKYTWGENVSTLEKNADDNCLVEKAKELIGV
ncbi:MAG: hypothetical protein WC872_01920 [Candidatus Absconditabacterales bacterium]|jgi:hypothetical protein